MTKTKPSDNLLFAESAAPSDVSDPPSAIRSTGYPFESALPHEELNYLLRSPGRHIDYLERTVGTFETATDADEELHGGDYGILQPFQSSDISSRYIDFASYTTTNDSSSVGDIDTNGLQVVVSKDDEITVLDEDLSLVGTHTVGDRKPGTRIAIAASSDVLFATYINTSDNVAFYVASITSPSGGSETEVGGLSLGTPQIEIACDNERAFVAVDGSSTLYIFDDAPSLVSTFSPGGESVATSSSSSIVAGSSGAFVCFSDDSTDDDKLYRVSSAGTPFLNGVDIPSSEQFISVVADNGGVLLSTFDSGASEYRLRKVDPYYTSSLLPPVGTDSTNISLHSASGGRYVADFGSDLFLLFEDPVSAIASLQDYFSGDLIVGCAQGPTKYYLLTNANSSGSDVHMVDMQTKPVFVKKVDTSSGEWPNDGNQITALPR